MEGSIQPTEPPKPAQAQAQPSAQPKLSGAELKKQKQLEKQAKRAAAKAVSAPVVPKGHQRKPSAASLAQAKASKPTTSSQQKPTKPQPGGPSSSGGKQATKPQKEKKQVEGWPKEIAMFRHLSIQRRAAIEGATKDVHPAVVAFGLQLSSYEICGSTARCIGMLQCFKVVIDAYKMPPDTAFARHFIPHEFSPQIEYIKSCRPLSVGMGNAIRYLKDCVVKIDPSSSEMEAKQLLQEQIDDFIRDRLTAAGTLIAKEAATTIKDGDVILTFAKSSIIQRVLLDAHTAGKKIRVIVVDSKPLNEGRRLAHTLRNAGLEVDYFPIAGICHAITQASKVLLGAHSMHADGRLYSRAGTAMVAMQAADHNLPVHVLCESYKFSEKILVDAFAQNEIAPSEELLEGQEERDVWLEKVKLFPSLNVFNPMYDLTPAEYIDELISEYGKLPPSSVPMLLVS